MLRDVMESGSPILADGGLETRIGHAARIGLEPHIAAAGLLDQRDGREALREAYGAYVDVAWAHGLPSILGTPTFRASGRFVKRAGRGGAQAVRRLNSEAVALLHDVRSTGDHEPVFIAGSVGPFGDPYEPQDGLDYLDGADYHRVQTEALAAAGADLLFAQTFPSAEEAHGVALAMAATRTPYAISFVLNERARLLDGGCLHEAIERIDGSVDPTPTHYGISCVHPTVARIAMRDLYAAAPRAGSRLREVQGNAAMLLATDATPVEFADIDPPDVFGEEMHQLAIDFNLMILGGCCGTGPRHLAAIAQRLEAHTA